MLPKEVMEKARSAMKCMEDAVLPFSITSINAFLVGMKPLFNLLVKFDEIDNVDQDYIVAFIIQNHLFEKFKWFLMKVIKAYPSLFSPEVGDKIPHELIKIYYGKVVKNEEIHSFVSNTCCLAVESLVNITDKSKQAQEACCADGLIQFLVADILPLLLDIKWEEETIREELLNRSLDVVYNCCKLPLNHKYYEDAKAVDVLVKIRDKTSHLQNETDITSLLTLGYLLDDSNNNRITSGQGTIKMLLEYVTTSLKNNEHNVFGFHLEELVTGLSHLAVQDENKDLICDAGGITVLAQVLKESKTDEELISCCNALWLLCFCKKGASLIEENKELKTSLNNAIQSKNTEVKKYAGGVLWQLRNTEEKTEEAKEANESSRSHAAEGVQEMTNKFDVNNNNKHIMISYQWDNQQVVKRIADFLKEKGYKVWMDVYEMKDYIMDDMAAAVEKAAILIVCLSRKYKNSPNTRRECDYAFQLRKNIIPLMMEKNYTPDGWLGILLGTKLWTDFSDQNLFDHKITELCTRLGNVCKALEPFVTPVTESIQFAGRDTPDDPFHGQHHPLHNHDMTDNGSNLSSKLKSNNVEMENQVLQWGNKEIVAWLHQKGIAGCMKKAVLKNLDGIHVVMLYKLYKTAPNAYLQTAIRQIGVNDFLDALKFTYHLERLFEEMPAQ